MNPTPLEIPDIFEPLYSEEAKQFLRDSRSILENLRKQLKKDLSQKLSLITIRQITLPNGKVLNSGDIIYRPLKNLKTDLNLDFNHYAIVLGVMEDGEKLVLEINSKDNVAVVNLKRFLNGHSITKINIERKPEGISIETIVKRAEDLQYATYSGTYLNCRHFVNYCVYGKMESDAVQNLAGIVAPILDIFATYWDFKAKFQDESGKRLLNDISTKIRGISENIKKLQ